MDYPQDNITTPNTAIAKLNGKDPNKRIGPSIILKVMAGDTIQAAVRAYYKQQAEPRKKVSIPAEQMLARLVQALVAPGSQVLSTHGVRLIYLMHKQLCTELPAIILPGARAYFYLSPVGMNRTACPCYRKEWP